MIEKKIKKITTKKIIKKTPKAVKEVKEVLETKPVEKLAEKPQEKKLEIKEELTELKLNSQKFFEAVGKRKTAIARVRLMSQKEPSFSINNKDIKVYFPLAELQATAKSALEKINISNKFGVSVKVNGGGVFAQAEAIRHGITKALILINPVFRIKFKKLGYLTRDPRMKERKKFGLKRARRAPQWAKR